MQSVALLLIGFSIFNAFVIAVVHFRPDNYPEQKLSRIAGTLLLFNLAALQWWHFKYLAYDIDVIHGSAYRVLLFSVAPLFYLFSMPLLQAQSTFRTHHLLHFIPPVAAVGIPYVYALPLAFAIGAGYLLWLFHTVYQLRAQRSRFRIELLILGVVFILGVGVSMMGLGLSWLGEPLFYMFYASAVGCAFLLISLVLGFAPQLARDVGELARETYAVSTLSRVDCTAAISRLESLMLEEKLYQDSALDLAMLAGRLELSGHQLSELINTRLGKNFARYLREYRVRAAQDMLLNQPDAAVLAIGMSVGYTSQSSFYDAFREITGMTPGNYRKLHAQQTPK